MYSEAVDFSEKRKAYLSMKTKLSSISVGEVLHESRLALEIGGSDGILAGMVSQSGPRVISTDIVDVNSKYDGEFPQLLKEKCERHGLELDLEKVEFHTMDAQSIVYGDNEFDLIFSFNALEHIPDPIKAVKESWRVLKPGGSFYASFDPVWTADSGSHFIHYTKEPWLHLLITDSEYCEEMKRAGASESECKEYRCAMNRLSAPFYYGNLRCLLDNLFSRCSLTHWSGCVAAEFECHENLGRAENATGLSREDLLIRGFEVVALK